MSISPKLIYASRELRKNMTKEEKTLWYQFLKQYPIRFYRQRVIGRFIVDFYCAKAKLVIELDGSQHYIGNGPAYDKERTEILKARGLTVLRFTNKDVNDHFKEVCEYIDLQVKQRKT